jgi:hypothetical protein
LLEVRFDESKVSVEAMLKAIEGVKDLEGQKFKGKVVSTK